MIRVMVIVMVRMVMRVDMRVVVMANVRVIVMDACVGEGGLVRDGNDGCAGDLRLTTTHHHCHIPTLTIPPPPHTHPNMHLAMHIAITPVCTITTNIIIKCSFTLSATLTLIVRAGRWFT
jgi:hypothetical protein